MKTPEEMAEEHANIRCPEQGPAFIVWCMCKDDFLAGYKAAQQWISVKDRLPEINEKVLVIFRNRIALAAIEENEDEFTKQGKFTVWKCLKLHKDDIYECYPWNDISHWMPLPEPPKDEK